MIKMWEFFKTPIIYSGAARISAGELGGGGGLHPLYTVAQPELLQGSMGGGGGSD